MALITWATHVIQGVRQKETKMRILVNLKKYPQFGLFFANQEYEGGITSNRRLVRCGES